MALKIRLRQQGRTNRPFYRFVVADVRSPRDGRFVETLGWYNPFETEDDKQLNINAERLIHWLGVGAEMTEKTECLIAKALPAIVRQQNEKVLAHKAKMAAKRRERRKAAAA